MSQENETEKYFTRASALTEVGAVREQNEYMQIVAKIRAKVRMVDAAEATTELLSSEELIAVIFVLDRFDMFGQWGTMLDGIERLRPEWLRAAHDVQRNGWE
jgi:hypothetical protein